MTDSSRNLAQDRSVADWRKALNRPATRRLSWLSIAAAIPLLVSASAQDSAPAPTVITSGNPGRAVPSGATQGAAAAARAVSPSSSPNALIVNAIESMPSGGGYRASEVAITALRGCMRIADSRLSLEPAQATPSFCSGATYLVFLAALNELQRAGRITMDDATIRALMVEHQPDGTGVWGRWNANGPGTARLFFETGLGRNFTSFEEARPGDFMKVWWNDQIGVLERGHSVVFLGQENRPDGPYVHYWSSNVPNGFGHAYVSRQKIRRVLFSRLEHPEHINRVTALPARDPYLASLLKKSSPPEQMAGLVGLAEGERSRLFPALLPSPTPAVRPPVPSNSPPPTGSAGASPSPASPTPKRSWLGNLFRKQ